MRRALSLLNPFDYASLAFEHQKMTMAACETVWHRSNQFASGTLTPHESVAMMMEKPTAFAKGYEEAALAAVGGKNPAAIMAAAMKPLAAKASANAKRLRK